MAEAPTFDLCNAFITGIGVGLLVHEALMFGIGYISRRSRRKQR